MSDFLEKSEEEVETCLTKVKAFCLYLKEASGEEIRGKISEFFLIAHTSGFSEYWDFLIMIAYCWNVFVLPIDIAFETQNKVTGWINVFVDMCFVIDIIVQFRTTIPDEDTGEDIKDSAILAKAYLHGRFTIDFLSTIPMDTIMMIFLEED